ncbi:hypothetical protein ABJI51_27330 [Amycolatopsis sp. NEAU-NG30]|uniref:Uncharacterized protein n=1 Tax=Amycolatopsis melonis TaxID=3156488 RepID=A0ABV0LN65_9PSEU
MRNRARLRAALRRQRLRATGRRHGWHGLDAGGCRTTGGARRLPAPRRGLLRRKTGRRDATRRPFLAESAVVAGPVAMGGTVVVRSPVVAGPVAWPVATGTVVPGALVVRDPVVAGPVASEGAVVAGPLVVRPVASGRAVVARWHVVPRRAIATGSPTVAGRGVVPCGARASGRSVIPRTALAVVRGWADRALVADRRVVRGRHLARVAVAGWLAAAALRGDRGWLLLRGRLAADRLRGSPVTPFRGRGAFAPRTTRTLGW